MFRVVKMLVSDMSVNQMTDFSTGNFIEPSCNVL